MDAECINSGRESASIQLPIGIIIEAMDRTSMTTIAARNMASATSAWVELVSTVGRFWFSG
jgi:hypothetical protein